MNHPKRKTRAIATVEDPLKLSKCPVNIGSSSPVFDGKKKHVAKLLRHASLSKNEKKQKVWLESEFSSKISISKQSDVSTDDSKQQKPSILKKLSVDRKNKGTKATIITNLLGEIPDLSSEVLTRLFRARPGPANFESDEFAFETTMSANASLKTCKFQTVTFKSCMKGKSSHQPPRQVIATKVSFQIPRHEQVHVIESLFKYEKEIWYSKKEGLRLLRQDFNKGKEAKQAAAYFKIFIRAQKIVFGENEGKSMYKSNGPRLELALYKELAETRNNGLAGYEHFNNECRIHRATQIDNHRKLVIAGYKRCIQENKSVKETEKRVRKCSKVASDPACQWAQVLGLADHEAADHVYLLPL